TDPLGLGDRRPVELDDKLRSLDLFHVVRVHRDPSARHRAAEASPRCAADRRPVAGAQADAALFRLAAGAGLRQPFGIIGNWFTLRVDDAGMADAYPPHILLAAER